MSLTGRTAVYGILGDPVGHSLSPAMQNAAFRAAGLDAVYVPFHVLPEALEEAVAGLRALNIRGCSVTVPHKESVCRLLDRLSPEARRIGAVNTIVNEAGALVGHNTDAPGFLRSLSEDLGFSPRGKRVLLLGAGGACRAAAAALGDAGVAWLGVANRSVGRARALAADFGGELSGTTFATSSLEPEDLAAVLARADLVANTSAVGLGGESFPRFPWDAVRKEALFYDMVYRPGGTPLLHTARDRGHATADGLGMLAAQGEEAFLLWTGRRPPSGVMKRQLLVEMADR